MRYLTSFGSESYGAVYNRCRYLKSPKSRITYIFFSLFCEIKIDSYDSIPEDKRLTSYNVTILMKSVINKDKNNHYYKILLEKCSYQLAKVLSQITKGLLIV